MFNISLGKNRKYITEVMLVPLLEQKRRIYVIVASLILLSLMQVLLVLAVGPFLQSLFTVSSDSKYFNVQTILPANIVKYYPDFLNYMVEVKYLILIIPIILLIAGAGRSLGLYFYNYNQQALSMYLAKTYRFKLFGKILEFPFMEIRQKSAAEWMSSIMNDVLFLQTRFSDIMSSFLKDTLLIISCVIALILLNGSMAVAMFILGVFLAFSLGKVARKIGRFAKTWQEELNKLVAYVLDVRSRFNFIRAQSGESTELKRFDVLNRRYYRSIRNSIFIRSIVSPSVEFAGFVVFAVGLFLFNQKVWGQTLSPLLVVQIFAAILLTLKPLRTVGEQIASLSETIGVLNQSLNIWQRSFELNEVTSCHSKSCEVGCESLKDNELFAIDLHIKKLTSGYENKIIFSCEDISLIQGKATAIVGPSGSGKSTFLKTLAGLVEPTLWEANVSWLNMHKATSLVSQEPFLFDDTLEENLLYGLDEDQRSKARRQLDTVLKEVNVLSEVEAMVLGLKSRITQISSNISGGQAQRFVIARALLRSPYILLCDEVTSAIDAKSEKEITSRLIERCRTQNNIFVAVTHRLKWLNQFDLIFFVENGKITLHGSYDELMSEPRFRLFCNSDSDTSKGEF